jgi:hypothetical protein
MGPGVEADLRVDPDCVVRVHRQAEEPAHRRYGAGLTTRRRRGKLGLGQESRIGRAEQRGRLREVDSIGRVQSDQGSPPVGNGDADHLRGIPEDKLQSGSSEIKNWIVAAGALSDLRFEVLDYVPGYRSAGGTGCGMAVARWS